MQDTVERWGVYEFSAPGAPDDNPYTQRDIHAVFTGRMESVSVDGFYDGDGTYRARFMPSFEGEYQYRVSGSFSQQTYEGVFTVTPASGENHGPLRVVNRYHFAYADDTPYYPVGTTCYTWALQSDASRQAALANFARGPFNKVRFSMWPHQHQLGNFTEGEPRFFPFVRKADGSFDFDKFDPAYFRDFEKQVQALGALGIQADVFAMNPYEEYGLKLLSREQALRYWRYLIARLAACRNIWWSLANEYDLFANRTEEDWEAFARQICVSDPYRRLRSIHHCRKPYDYARAWITHCCVQCQDITVVPGCAEAWRQYEKPVVFDEIAYEGNFARAWGSISGEEMTRRFWMAGLTGGYATHGEVLLQKMPERPWMRGGEYSRGQSPSRLAFLKTLLYQTPGYGLRLRPWRADPRDAFCWDDLVAVPEERRYENAYFLVYYGRYQPASKVYRLSDAHTYRVDVIDTWNQTIQPAGVFRGTFRVALPQRPFIAVRIVRDDVENPVD